MGHYHPLCYKTKRNCKIFSIIFSDSSRKFHIFVDISIVFFVTIHEIWKMDITNSLGDNASVSVPAI